MHLSFTSRFWLLGCVVLLGLAAVAMHLGRFHWFGDVVALVAAYLCVLTAVLLLLCAARRAWRLVAAASSVLLLTATPLLTYPSVQPTPTTASARSLRVLVYDGTITGLMSAHAFTRSYNPLGTITRTTPPAHRFPFGATQASGTGLVHACRVWSSRGMDQDAG